MPDAERAAVAFARSLRAAGLVVPTECVTNYVRALAEVGITERAPLYWAGRATMIRSPEDVPLYDRVFDAFWSGGQAGDLAVSTVVLPSTLALDDDTASPDDAARHVETATVTVRFSAAEVLSHKDFAQLTEQELDETRRLMTDLRVAGALRRSRRLRRTKRSHGHLDLRRTARRALRTGGEPIVRRHLEESLRPRRVVILCDVSGSMDPYARALVRFVHAAVAGRTKVEAFALGTRLTRLTRELSWRDPDVALARAADAVVDWSGGTRLGQGLKSFNDHWGVRGMARGAVVVILSDGWDRGDPEEVATEMHRLRLVAHRVVWVNPLKATPGYAPLARGMAAALPFVDDFVEGHSLASLRDLARVISR